MSPAVVKPLSKGVNELGKFEHRIPIEGSMRHGIPTTTQLGGFMKDLSRWGIESFGGPQSSHRIVACPHPNTKFS
jgi:hypothetical protein